MLARETTPGRRRREERKRREGKGPLEFFNIPMPLHVALFFSLSFSFVLFHIITRSRKSRSRTLESRGRFRFSGSMTARAIPRACLPFVQRDGTKCRGKFRPRFASLADAFLICFFYSVFRGEIIGTVFVNFEEVTDGTAAIGITRIRGA